MTRKFLLGIASLFLIGLLGCESTPAAKAGEADAKVKVGISWDRVYKDNVIPSDTQVYIDALKKVGAEPVLLGQIKTEKDAVKELNKVDAVIMTGGEDINPKYYNEKPHEKLEAVKDDRDTSDYLLLTTALKKDYPILGTCRGMQLLNVVQGGTLYQDIPTQHPSKVLHRDPKREDFVDHACKIDPNSHLYKILKKKEVTVNSWHHQGVKDLGKDLKVVATAPDGIIEAIEVPSASFVLGVQFHPEWHVEEDGDLYLEVFEALKAQAIKHRNKK